MHTFAVAALAVLACAACDQVATSERPVDPPSPEPAAPQSAWALDEKDSALVHRDAAGAEVLRLTCGPRPAELHTALPGFTRVASEDRLTLGIGDELANMVVSMEGPDLGLIASGQPPSAILAPLAAGAPVGVSYGARQMMLDGPPPEVGAAFAAGCRG
jgi:hypothetical protein